MVDTISDWRYKEIAKLESVWSPVGVSIYLSSLVDPQDVDLKKVWAVSITDRLPTDDKCETIALLTLREIHKTDLKKLVVSINHSRGEKVKLNMIDTDEKRGK